MTLTFVRYPVQGIGYEYDYEFDYDDEHEHDIGEPVRPWVSLRTSRVG